MKMTGSSTNYLSQTRSPKKQLAASTYRFGKVRVRGDTPSPRDFQFSKILDRGALKREGVSQPL